MADSSSNLDTISASQASKEVTANALFDSLSPASLFGRRASTTSASGLTWGFYGGKFRRSDGSIATIVNGTVTLTNNATNYIYADDDGVVTKTTSAPSGWPGPLAIGSPAGASIALYSVVTSGGAVTSYTDYRTTDYGFGGTGASTAITQGKHTVPVMAAAMTSRTTNGPASGTTESATNKIMLRTLDFDASTDEFAQFMVPMPKSWNEGTVTAQFLWSCGVTGNVVWGIQAVAMSNDDVIDVAFGTAQTVTDGVTATTDLMVSDETAAITIAGSPAEGDLVCFQVYRDADNASDTAAGDAKLIGIRLFMTINAGNDA